MRPYWANFQRKVRALEGPDMKPRSTMRYPPGSIIHSNDGRTKWRVTESGSWVRVS